jgi:hypothetical protein
VSDDYRSEATLTGTEREQLEAFLQDNRMELVATVDGLTDGQARRRLVPSLTSPLAILKHCVFVEKVWFHVSLVGRTRDELGMPEDAHDSWALTDEDTIESVLADYKATWAESDAIAAAYTLDELAVHNRRGPLTLRWIYLHMIEELARHAGHGDILKEQILVAEAPQTPEGEAGR